MVEITIDVSCLRQGVIYVFEDCLIMRLATKGKLRWKGGKEFLLKINDIKGEGLGKYLLYRRMQARSVDSSAN